MLPVLLHTGHANGGWKRLVVGSACRLLKRFYKYLDNANTGRRRECADYSRAPRGGVLCGGGGGDGVADATFRTRRLNRFIACVMPSVT